MILISYCGVIYSTFRQRKLTKKKKTNFCQGAISKLPYSSWEFQDFRNFDIHKISWNVVSMLVLLQRESCYPQSLKKMNRFGMPQDSLQHPGINLYPCHVAMTMPLLYSMSISSSEYLTSTAIEGEAHLPLLLPLSLPLFSPPLDYAWSKAMALIYLKFHTTVQFKTGHQRQRKLSSS